MQFDSTDSEEERLQRLIGKNKRSPADKEGIVPENGRSPAIVESDKGENFRAPAEASDLEEEYSTIPASDEEDSSLSDEQFNNKYLAGYSGEMEPSHEEKIMNAIDKEKVAENNPVDHGHLIQATEMAHNPAAREAVESKPNKTHNDTLALALMAAIPTLAGSLLSPYSAAQGAVGGAQAGISGIEQVEKKNAEQRKFEQLKQLAQAKAQAKTGSARVAPKNYTDENGQVRIGRVGPDGVLIKSKDDALAGFAPQVRTNRTTGVAETINPNMSMGRNVSGQQQEKQIDHAEQKQSDQQLKALPPAFRKVLDKEKESIGKNKEVIEARTALGAVDDLQKVLESDNPLEILTTKIETLRASGLNRVTQNEITAMGGSPATLSRFKQAIQSASNGRWTEENRQAFTEMAAIRKQLALQRINGAIDEHMQSVKANYPEIPMQNINGVLGVFKRGQESAGQQAPAKQQAAPMPSPQEAAKLLELRRQKVQR